MDSEEKKIASADDVLAWWSDLMGAEDESMVQRLKASELLAKAYGLFRGNIRTARAEMEYGEQTEQYRAADDGMFAVAQTLACAVVGTDQGLHVSEDEPYAYDMKLGGLLVRIYCYRDDYICVRIVCGGPVRDCWLYFNWDTLERDYWREHDLILSSRDDLFANWLEAFTLEGCIKEIREFAAERGIG